VKFHIFPFTQNYLGPGTGFPPEHSIRKGYKIKDEDFSSLGYVLVKVTVTVSMFIIKIWSLPRTGDKGPNFVCYEGERLFFILPLITPCQAISVSL
jgi:hypothetical protein